MSDPTAQAKQVLERADKRDLGIVAAGLVALIGSVLPFYTVSADFMGSSISSSASAWHGFFGWFGVLAALAGSALLLVHLLGVRTPVAARLGTLAAYAVAALCLVIALFAFPGGGCDDLTIAGTDVCEGIDFGRGVGYWLTLLAVLGGLALSVLRRGADDSTTTMPASAPPAPPAAPAPPTA